MGPQPPSYSSWADITSRLVAFEDITTQDGRPYIGILADDDSRWLIRVISNGVSSYPVANIDDGLKVRTVGIDVADAATMEAVCSSYNSGITPFEDSVAEPPAGMSKPYLLRLASACAWDGEAGSASLVVEDGKENVIFNSDASPSTVFSEAEVKSVEEITYARFVDMGLPSGLLWATCNIDASKPAGMTENEFTYNCSFFSWGNTEPHNPVSNSAFDYNWGTVNEQEPWFEGQPYGSTTGATLNSVIPLENDAARVICGDPWRMPKASEFKELFDNVDYLNEDGTIKPAGAASKGVTLNGINGVWIQSKINGNRLFFAFSGYGVNTSLNNRNVVGYFWSASINSERNAMSLLVSGGDIGPQHISVRARGFTVRPVREANRRRRKESEDEEQRLEVSKNESEQRQVISENKSKRRKKVSKNESDQSQKK